MDYMLTDFITGANIWTRSRQAVSHLVARIDISDGNIITIFVDDVCSTPRVVGGLRLLLQQWSLKCIDLKHS